ncbi:MAG: hypothetical protein Q4G36_01295 [Paracoccus sp. (in: a-proteobacteria)]|nr:hypothetical protein [Paracoccus sp. (in: a-proteobacteria)]
MIEHDGLRARLKQVLGAEISGHIAVRSVKLYGDTAIIEVRMGFEKENIPPNFRPKSRNSLYILLDVPDYSMEVSSLGETHLNLDDQFIKSTHIVFQMGRYKYAISGKAIFVSNLQSYTENGLCC